MRNAHVAQWMLSLVTTPDRAASTVGDLLEDPATGGPIRFWGSIAFTVVALLCGELAASPWRMARLAVYGIILQFLSLFVLILIVLVASLVIGSGARSYAPPIDASTSTGAITLALFGVLSQFQVGRMLAKRSPGTELAACMATTIFGYAVPIVIFLAMQELAVLPAGQMSTVFQTGTFVEFVAYQILPFLALLAGAARVRRHRLSLPS